MDCPRDATPLARRTRNGVEIDHCPTCRGVWLDRGELDKIIVATIDAGAGVSRGKRAEDDTSHYIGELFDF